MVPEGLPPWLFATIVVGQVLVVIGLVLLARKLVKAIHGIGQTVFPRDLTARVKKILGGRGSPK